MGMSREQWAASRPPLTEFNQFVFACWNFAGGWQVDQLQQAAVFYGVDDLDLLLRLAMKIRNALHERKQEQHDGDDVQT